MPPPTLSQLASDAQSPNQAIRGKAVQDLLFWCQRDPSIASSVLPIFQRMVGDWRDAWSCRCAVRGIELIQGVAAAREIRLKLLSDSREEVVMGAALEITDPAMTPDLIAALSYWREPRVRQTFLAALGRLHHPEALPVLAAELRDPQNRPHAVEAIKHLGDRRAIAMLLPYRNDGSPAWPVDNHGPMLFVRDLVAEAIVSLSRQAPPPIPQAADGVGIAGISQRSGTCEDRKTRPTVRQSSPEPSGAAKRGGVAAGAFGVVCIFVGVMSILANLYALTVAQGAYEFSRTPSVAGGPAVAIAPSPGSPPSVALDPDLAARIAKAANQMAGWKFTAAEIGAIQVQLETDNIGFARARDESAVVAAFVNSDGNAVVTFDTARTLLISATGQVLTVFSPTLPGGGVKVSLALILIEGFAAAALLGLGIFLIRAGVVMRADVSRGRGMLRTYIVLKIPLAIIAAISITGLDYQTDAGSILGEAGLMGRIVMQGILLLAVGLAFPILVLMFLGTGALRMRH